MQRESREAFEEHEGIKRQTEAYLKCIDDDRLGQQNRIQNLEENLKVVFSANWNDFNNGRPDNSAIAQNSITGEQEFASNMRKPHDANVNVLEFGPDASCEATVHVSSGSSGDQLKTNEMLRVILNAIESQQTKSLVGESPPERSRENVIKDHRLTADGENVSVQRFCVRLGDVDFDDFSPEQKNKITDMLRTQISRKSGVLSQKVWAGLQKGSLVVSGEVQEPNNYQAPAEEEVRAIVRLVQGENEPIAEPAGE